MDIVVVYKSNRESLQKVLGLLRKEGFNPTTLENPGSAENLRGAGGAAYLISIAVPRDEAAGARSVLSKWDKARQSEVDAITRKLAGPLILSTMIVATLAVILLVLQVLGDAAALLAVIWIVLFAVLANLDRIRLRAGRPRDR